MCRWTILRGYDGILASVVVMDNGIVWNMRSGNCTSILRPKNEQVGLSEVPKDGNYNKVFAWDAEGGKYMTVLLLHEMW